MIVSSVVSYVDCPMPLATWPLQLGPWVALAVVWPLAETEAGWIILPWCCLLGEQRVVEAVAAAAKGRSAKVGTSLS